jgi:hypothetical protein
MVLIVSMNKDSKIETKIVPSIMETVIRRLMEKYEYAQEQVYINNAITWAVVQVCRELRGDL